MTNYERIKAMTFDELAEFFCANFDFDIDSAREMLKKNFDAIYNDENKTDNEIIKALEKIASYSGFTDNVSNTIKSTLDIISRLQAENERLEYDLELLKQEKRVVKNNAIKEFADKLKENADTETYYDSYDGKTYEYKISTVYVDDIDILVKEMVGEE